uniref:Uncharacterized protein n=1 Tax=Solanum lycopersicum TaxID=4081 RepID=A0A3Q7JH99_SOLLC
MIRSGNQLLQRAQSCPHPLASDHQDTFSFRHQKEDTQSYSPRNPQSCARISQILLLAPVSTPRILIEGKMSAKLNPLANSTNFFTI